MTVNRRNFSYNLSLAFLQQQKLKQKLHNIISPIETCLMQQRFAKRRIKIVLMLRIAVAAA